MEVDKILSYLIYPAKKADQQPEIGGTEISKGERVYTMLSELLIKSEQECNIPICFSSNANGKQQNDCRDEIVEVIQKNSLDSGKRLAQRLQKATTSRSGLGLLFLTTAKSGNKETLMMSRFPADQGFIAEQSSNSLRVKFIEEVFLKNSHSYKAVLYSGSSFDSDFWFGNAVDKQINYGAVDVANYWIKDFLLSDFKTTSEAGTKRLAMALRNAVSNTHDQTIKHEIAAAAALSKNFKGQITSINEFCSHFHFSDSTCQAVTSNVQQNRLVDDRFCFSTKEFSQHLSYKSLELDNGATLTASIDKFEECFEQELVVDDSGDSTFKTRGKIVNERLRKSI